MRDFMPIAHMGGVPDGLTASAERRPNLRGCPGVPAQFAAIQLRDIGNWSPLVRRVGVTVD